MFTGLVQSLGKFIRKDLINECERFYFESTLLKDSKVDLGDSVSCNGVCLTVAEINDEVFGFDVMQETLNLTSLKHLNVNDLVNLELALMPSSRLGGHIVTGHIDFCTTLLSVQENKYLFAMNADFKKYIAVKGSVTINGVSLTVVDSNMEYFSVCLIPITIIETNFHKLNLSDFVNIEIDVLARYIENLIQK